MKFLKKVIMAILDRIKTSALPEVESFTLEEVEFLLIKLRTADYKGSEFETFFNIYVKLTKELESLRK